MTYGTGVSHAYRARSRASMTWRMSPAAASGALLLGACALGSAWMLAARPFARVEPIKTSASRPVPAAPGPQARPIDRALALAIFAPPLGVAAPLASNLEAPAPGPLRTRAAELEAVAPEPDVSHLAQAEPPGAVVPLPTPRPHDLDGPPGPVRNPERRLAQANRVAPAPQAPADTRSLFDKLFGLSPQPPGPVLAYAAPEDGAMRRGPSLVPPTAAVAPVAGGGTAIYDIAAHMVYLPNGQSLEAHSGLGDLLDDPGHVDKRNRGATPPQVYDLTLREKLFHGVQALRLTPVGDGSVFGRGGLLAHSYMLGPNGQSNGCVSFRDYDAFLRAFQNGEVKRLSVVARRI